MSESHIATLLGALVGFVVSKTDKALLEELACVALPLPPPHCRRPLATHPPSATRQSPCRFVSNFTSQHSYSKFHPLSSSHFPQFACLVVACVHNARSGHVVSPARLCVVCGSWVDESWQMVFIVALPLVIFDGAYSMKRARFFSNLTPILLLSIVGTVVSAVCIGVGLWFLGYIGAVYPVRFVIVICV